MIILLILISIFIVGFCYYNRKLQERQREDDEQQRSSDLFNGINEYSAARTSCVNVDQNQSLPSRTELQSESHLSLLRRWKNFRDDRIARRNVQLSAPVQTQESMIIGVDPPPSYEGKSNYSVVLFLCNILLTSSFDIRTLSRINSYELVYKFASVIRRN